MVHKNGHPYYPLDLKLPGYQAMVVDFDYILGVFFAGVGGVALATWFLSGKQQRLTTVERILCCWFMVTGVIHFVIEGYVVANAEYYKDTAGNYLSDAWKEYSKADSRYSSRDSFIISMEAVTAFLWGPLCPAVAYGIATSAPWRFTLMSIISVGQMYGDVLYYGTCYLEGFVHSRPEALYFWGYFVALNALWVVIPAAVLLYAAGNISAAVGTSSKAAEPKPRRRVTSRPSGKAQ